MTIRVLDAYTAGQIAAGEVVERPASIVKELIENAVDAGATEIRVELREGGRRELRISDNGSGIPAAEIEIAFQRHATSKLQSASDLFDIHTLGFRGEALPSIAAVAQVLCTSRTADATTGVELRIEGGEVLGRTPRGTTVGTSFVVKNLFFNAPVRLKFLRSDASEAAFINQIVSNYALAYPGIRWLLMVDGRLSLQTPGSGQLLDAVVELYGLDVARQLLPVADAAGEGEMATTISGYVSQPSLHRSARSGLHVFVNHRWVQAKGQLAFVVEEAYHTLLMKGRHPLAVLSIEVAPGAVDVNVHPTKSEVKFLYEPQVFALIGRAVRAALAEHVPVAAFTLPADNEVLPRRIELRPAGRGGDEQASVSDEPDAPLADATELPDEAVQRDVRAPTLGHTPQTWVRPSTPGQSNAQSSTFRPNTPYAPTFTQRPPSAPQPHIAPAQQTTLGIADAPERGPHALPALRVVGQINETYIVAEAADGLYLVDQHAAHERVVYERLMAQAADNPLEQQNLLLVAEPALPPAVATILLGHAEELQQWGFRLQLAEDGEVAVHAVPAGLGELQIGPALLEIADHLASGEGSTPQQWRETILTTVACHTAIRAGQTLSHEEMRQLLQQLERCEFPRTCPHGRPTALLLSQTQLERQFGRKG